MPMQMDEFGQRMFVAEFAVSRKVFSALSKELQSGVRACRGLRDWGWVLIGRLHRKDMGRVVGSCSSLSH